MSSIIGTSMYVVLNFFQYSIFLFGITFFFELVTYVVGHCYSTATDNETQSRICSIKFSEVIHLYSKALTKAMFLLSICIIELTISGSMSSFPSLDEIEFIMFLTSFSISNM